MEEIEKVPANTETICCDGGQDGLGHPAVYYSFNNQDKVFYIENNPYLINNMEPYLYTSFLPKIHQLKQKNTINSASWIVTNIYDSYNDVVSSKNNCKLKYTTYPEKIMNLNNNWRRLKLNWYIIYCQ